MIVGSTNRAQARLRPYSIASDRDGGLLCRWVALTRGDVAREINARQREEISVSRSPGCGDAILLAARMRGEGTPPTTVHELPAARFFLPATWGGVDG